jgi:hypothetical protein
MYSIIAVKILNMTCAARLTPELPCFLLLGEDEDEWKLLYCVANKSNKEPKEDTIWKKTSGGSGKPAKRGWSEGEQRQKNFSWGKEPCFSEPMCSPFLTC